MRFPRRRKAAASAARGDAGIGDECELFLAGRYADHLRLTAAPMPSWIALNYLAHGTLAELADLRRDGAAGLGPAPSASLAALAGDVLDVVGHDAEALRTLQDEVLVPLELGLARDWSSRLTPAELVAVVSREIGPARGQHRPTGDSP